MAIKGIFYVFAEVSDLAHSKKFYGEILGWKLNTDEKDVAGFACDLHDQHWGERNFSFHDPDRHTWFYGQSMHGQV